MEFLTQSKGLAKDYYKIYKKRKSKNNKQACQRGNILDEGINFCLLPYGEIDKQEEKGFMTLLGIGDDFNFKLSGTSANFNVKDSIRGVISDSGYIRNI